ncbi:hypothetical protein KEM55_002590 [Ascosphaera atra]|nr:hypothetical protein KEM55_002590 [Ascosphaera atra]
MDLDTAQQVCVFYAAKALYWEDIPPPVLAAAELVSGRAAVAPSLRDTPEEKDLARQTRHRHGQSQQPLWPPLWSSGEPTDLTRAVIAFYNNTAAIRGLQAYREAYVHLVEQERFGRKPSGPVSLRRAPPYTSELDPIVVELRRTNVTFGTSAGTTGQDEPGGSSPTSLIVIEPGKSSPVSLVVTEPGSLHKLPPMQPRSSQGSPPHTVEKRTLAE